MKASMFEMLIVWAGLKASMFELSILGAESHKGDQLRQGRRKNQKVISETYFMDGLL